MTIELVSFFAGMIFTCLMFFFLVVLANVGKRQPPAGAPGPDRPPGGLETAYRDRHQEEGE